MLDAGCWMLVEGAVVIAEYGTSRVNLRLSIIQIIVPLVIFISGCTSAAQPKIVSQVSAKPAPFLIGVNHLFTIEEQLSQPSGVAVDTEGNLYVADAGRSAIYIFSRDGRLMESIGRSGWETGEFDSPADVAVDSRLRLYIADSGNNRIQGFSLLNRNFSVIAGESENEPETSVSLSGPQSIAVDVRGYVYIADTWNHRILELDPLGRIQMEIGGLGWTGQQLMTPQGVTVDAKGNIYISDTGNHRVHKLDFSGSPIVVWGKEGVGKGEFQNPAGQAIDRFGNIYVADKGNHRVQIFSPEGIYLTEFGQQNLDTPIDVAVDSGFRVYVADVSAGDIEVFTVIYKMADNIR